MKPSKSKKLPDVECAQQRLEILAVNMGIKPVAVLHTGNGDGCYRKDLEKLIRTFSLYVCVGPRWLAPSDLESLPAWYRTGWSMRDEGPDLLYVSRERSLAQILCGLGRNSKHSIGGEAELLGYPLCCVEDYHRKVRELHQMNARLIFDYCKGDREKMQRWVRAGVELKPRGEQELAGFLSLVKSHFAPYTSIAMCRDCRRGLSREAECVSENMRKLLVLQDHNHQDDNSLRVRWAAC